MVVSSLTFKKGSFPNCNFKCRNVSLKIPVVLFRVVKNAMENSFCWIRLQTQ